MARRLLFAAAVLVLCVVAVLAYRSNTSRPLAVGESSAAPILVAGVNEPAEMRVAPFPTSLVPEPLRMEGDAPEGVDLKRNPSAMIAPLNRILAKYPDWWDGYAGRAAFLCEHGDRAAALLDLETSLKQIDNVTWLRAADILSMRAWIEHANGDDASALTDLDKAIRSDLRQPTKFVNSGATEPEKTATAQCIWTETDLDALVNRFPSDARSWVARGLYFSFFTFWNHDTLQPALASFQSAERWSAGSGLPHLFVADVLQKAHPFSGVGMSDADRDALNRERLDELSKAISLEPNLVPALEDRASLYLNLKQYAQADFDKVTPLDPNDVLALNDRGVTKMQTGDFYGATSDFTSAIARKERAVQPVGVTVMVISELAYSACKYSTPRETLFVIAYWLNG
jgi:tetratricopeptide (TPR) repeat protein